ncbi:ABC transporter substrate-binding protein [Parvibaculum sedimenti]|uniref:ABC transporter substrate-binding protein n=1 Tax=Parvibaculum sedimenti TaxID=2608632 RepID=A0A6N6VL94_9HYPH|nr:branched-chain amino acid ABC transporter substrate-binding protein [Parvibaculum sedimenti]KAB7742098.1 ABC transporter substrate-binding protein [Parvibaculum sedimenti]
MTRYIVALAAILSLGLFACSKKESGITIGVAGPVSGSEAVFGEQFVHGAQRAVADINARGGVLGKKLNLVIGDDACDPKQAVSVANDMASKGVVFVAGHYCSGSSIPASDVYNESGIVQISPASTNPEFTERGLPNVFRVCGRDDAQGPTAAAYVAAHFAGKKIAVVDDKSTYGKGLADQFKKSLNAKGVTEVLRESISAGEKDYSPLVSKLKQAQADVLYFGGYKTEGGLITRQMREQGLKTILVSGDALVTDEYWSITGAAGEGTLMTFGPDPRLDPKNAELVAAFRADKYEPEAYTLYTYAAVQAWAQAAEKVGSTDAAKVEAALKSNKFDTVLGKIGFDAKGDMDAPGYVFYVWKNGKYAYAE